MKIPTQLADDANTMPIGQSQATRCVEQQLDKEMHNVEEEVTKGVGKVVAMLAKVQVVGVVIQMMVDE